MGAFLSLLIATIIFAPFHHHMLVAGNAQRQIEDQFPAERRIRQYNARVPSSFHLPQWGGNSPLLRRGQSPVCRHIQIALRRRISSTPMTRLALLKSTLPTILRAPLLAQYLVAGRIIAWSAGQKYDQGRRGGGFQHAGCQRNNRLRALFNFSLPASRRTCDH